MYSPLNAKLLSSLALAALMTTVTGTARADSMHEEIRLLKAQLRALERKVAEQDRAQKKTNAVVARVATTGGGAPGMYTKGPLPVMASCGGSAFAFKGVCITPGGFIEFASIYRSRATQSDEDSGFGNIPFGNNRIGKTNETRFTARQSRFALKVQGDLTPVTHITAYGEIDFQGAAQTANFNQTDSFQPRIRQAWASVDRDDFGAHFTAGQTWSLAGPFSKGLVLGKENIPLTIDGGEVPGFVYERQPQVRITKDLGPFTVGFSAEQAATIVSGAAPAGFVANGPAAAGTGVITSSSSNTVTANQTAAGAAGTVVTAACGGFSNAAASATTTGGTLTSGDRFLNACNTYSLSRVPDLIGKVAFDPTFYGRTLHFEGYGVLRDFYDRTGIAVAVPGGSTAIAGGTNRDVFAGGVGGSFVIPIIPKFLEANAEFQYGQGTGRYASVQLPDVTFGANGALKPIENTQVFFGLTAHPTEQVDLYAYAGQEENSRTPVGTGGYGNFLASNAGCSIEGSTLPCNGATRAVRQATGGVYYTPFKGSYGKVQFGAQYSYTERVGFSSISGPSPKGSDNIFMTNVRYYPF